FETYATQLPIARFLRRDEIPHRWSDQNRNFHLSFLDGTSHSQQRVLDSLASCTELRETERQTTAIFGSLAHVVKVGRPEAFMKKDFRLREPHISGTTKLTGPGSKTTELLLPDAILKGDKKKGKKDEGKKEETSADDADGESDNDDDE